MAARLMIVDDDRFLLENMRRFLSGQGFEVLAATSGEEALVLLGQDQPDLMILDIGLPGVDGLGVCRRVRTKWRFPVLMLTARSDAMDKVVGLEVGADDYLTKPFEPVELLARVRALLRRATEYVQEDISRDTLQIGDLVVDFAARDAFVRGEPARLTKREFELLAFLARNAGRVLDRDTIFEQVWGYDPDFNSNSLDVIVYRLRRKIERDPLRPEYLLTVRGYGFKLQSPES